jgi:hypothetical protein
VTTRTALDVEAALQARGAVRRGRHLRFACVAHPDERPSADFDPVQGVWICRSCHAGGGARDLAQRLGLETEAPRPVLRPPRMPPPPRGVSRAAWRPAWLAVCERTRREDRRLAAFREVFRVSDALRERHQLEADARRVVSALGPDDPRAWRLAGLAARVATQTAAIEHALDALVRYAVA